jgi:hypothetical protein
VGPVTVAGFPFAHAKMEGRGGLLQQLELIQIVQHGDDVMVPRQAQPHNRGEIMVFL